MKNSSKNLSEGAYSKKKRYFKQYPEMKLLEAARRRAKLCGFDFDLKREDITVPTHCPILGIPIQFKDGKRQDDSLSIDRIDSTKGYTKDNILICSWRANNIKKDATVDELDKIVSYLKGLPQNGGDLE